MPFWILVLIGVVVLRRVVWGRGWARAMPAPPRPLYRLGPYRPHRRDPARWRGRDLIAENDEGSPARPALPPARETHGRVEPRSGPVARLQKDWVAGRISDEEFERGLDAVYADPRRR